MPARHVSCTSQRDRDEANEIVQHNKRPMGIPFLTPMNDRILNWASPVGGSPVITPRKRTIKLLEILGQVREYKLIMHLLI